MEENKSLEANTVYINKCIDFLNSICFKVNKLELTEQLETLIADYKLYMDDIENSNINPDRKMKTRSIIKSHFQDKVKASNFINQHPAIVGTLINLFRAIHRHYNLKNKISVK